MFSGGRKKGGLGTNGLKRLKFANKVLVKFSMVILDIVLILGLALLDSLVEIFL